MSCRSFNLALKSAFVLCAGRRVESIGGRGSILDVPGKRLLQLFLVFDLIGTMMRGACAEYEVRTQRANCFHGYVSQPLSNAQEWFLHSLSFPQAGWQFPSRTQAGAAAAVFFVRDQSARAWHLFTLFL